MSLEKRLERGKGLMSVHTASDSSESESRTPSDVVTKKGRKVDLHAEPSLPAIHIDELRSLMKDMVKEVMTEMKIPEKKETKKSKHLSGAVSKEKEPRVVLVNRMEDGPTPSKASHVKNTGAKGVPLRASMLGKLPGEGSKFQELEAESPRGGVEKELTRRIHQLSAELENLKEHANMPTERGIRASPFSDAVLGETLPHDFRSPSLPVYDGKGDPEEHIYVFDANMQLFNLSDAISCRVFITTLSGRARTWFTQLPQSSIHNFSQLRSKFLYHFASNKRCKRGAIHLYNIRQNEGETLRSFIQRFNDEVLNVTDVTMGIIVNVLMHGLRPGRFLDSIAANPPSDMDELLKEAEKFINVEEVYLMKKGEKGQSRREVRAEGRPRDTASKKVQFTPLNVSLTTILRDIKDSPNLVWPRKTKDTPQKLSSRKYCRFHRDKGHNTDDCFHLQEEVQRMINEGGLTEYLQDRRPPRSSPMSNEGLSPRNDRNRGRSLSPRRKRTNRNRGPRSPRPRSPRQRSVGPRSPGRRSPRNARDNRQPNRGVIHTISGGPQGGDSSNARKRYSRELGNSEVYPVDTEKYEITFTEKDIQGVSTPHADPLVIKANIAGFEVWRVLIDNGSSADIMTVDTLRQLGISCEKLKAVHTPLIGFGGARVEPLGMIDLPMTLGDDGKNRTEWTTFLVVKHSGAYNVILGRPSMCKFQMIVSAYHLKLKFPTRNGIGECAGNQRHARSCYVVSTREEKKEAVAINQKRKAPEEPTEAKEKMKQKIEPSGEVNLVEIVPGDPDKKVRIGSQLEGPLRIQVIECLRNNVDVFAWSTEDIVGISLDIITHRLNVDPTMKPVFQKKRNFGPEKDKAVEKEVDRLLAAKQIEEIIFPEWLSNVVMVPKSDDKWRMCTDFTDLNKACPKDPFPLPRIDLLVDSTAGCQLLSFLDAFQGYNQIKMYGPDKAKTAFVTERGIYCYNVMPFGLKNAGATYQRLINMMFKEQLGKTMEAYVDDMLVKSKHACDHVLHLNEVFSVLREYNMKLNPLKCAFGVDGGKFLGFMVTQRGIEANPEKIRAIQDMPTPRTPKEVQRLTGRLAALTRFISRSADRSLPFFKTLKKGLKFTWNNDCERAFEELKKYLVSPPMLSQPVTGEKLFLYLAVSDCAVSGVLIREDEGHQRPVYYVSKVLLDTETRYTESEKWALALVMASRKLRPYFLSHSIVVVTDQPLRTILGRPEVSGRLAKWVIELGAYDIDYKPRISVKAQAVADFCVDNCQPSNEDSRKLWIAHVDGSSTTKCGGVGVWMVSPEGDELDFSIKLNFGVTNNEAEYEAVLRAIVMIKEQGGVDLQIFTDSQLIAKQINGEYEIKGEALQKYHQKVQDELRGLTNWKISQISREENKRADALARLGSSFENEETTIKVTLLTASKTAIEESDFVGQLEMSQATWLTSIKKFLETGEVPESQGEARRVKMQAPKFVLEGGILYRKSFAEPLKRCLEAEEAQSVLKEIHMGCCGNHSGGRSLAFKALRQGYYWPTMMRDSLELSKKCQQCQFHARLIHKPAVEQEPIYTCCPFDRWGIDIVGPLPLARAQKKWLLVAVEYFSKWVEADALATITEGAIIEFIWKNIICRYGIPRILVSDNGSQFIGKKIQSWCEELKIKQHFTSVGHPQANGQVEVTNRILLENLSRRLSDFRGKWVDELPGVLWAYRTTPRVTTGETPYSLVYGSEALIPAEIAVPSRRLEKYGEGNNELRIREMDLLEERRQTAYIRMAGYKARVARRYNQRVYHRGFSVGDLVLKNKEVSKHVGKLEPRWEGPFRVDKVLGSGAYLLSDLEGKALPRSWNVINLRKYFV